MGTAIMAAGTDASAYANNYLPPVTGPLAWANLESDLLPAGRRLKNFGSLGGTFALSGIAQLVAKVLQRQRYGKPSDSGYLYAGCLHLHRAGRRGPGCRDTASPQYSYQHECQQKLQRVMDAGTSVSDITAPATGAFAVFLCGDSTGHAFGIVTASGIQKSTSTAVNSGTTATWMGGTNQAGLAAAWAGYGSAFYDRKLSDSEMERVAERLIKRARYLGVTVNG
ncbi:hypothetical protein LOF13_27960 [Klebsiella pneumoniae subsp. pneumoniae]|nr:hypothetical protein LOF13_27960 [Klebsiella pneumoniae subsp. pneumoniae]